MARREDRSHPKPQDSCTIEFDGASRGNPGRAGAGAVLRAPDNTVLFRSREGLGSATNNVAEYRALNLGLETALNNGFRNVRVQGDSQLVCKQVQFDSFLLMCVPLLVCVVSIRLIGSRFKVNGQPDTRKWLSFVDKHMSL